MMARTGKGMGSKVGPAQPLYCSRAARIAIRALYGEGSGVRV
jgi:hypothetical protein